MGGAIDPDLRGVADEMLMDAVEQRQPCPTAAAADGRSAATEIEELEAADDEIDVATRSSTRSQSSTGTTRESYSAPV